MLQNPRAWVGGVATLDLIARLPEDVLIPLVSVFVGAFPYQTVAIGTTWLVFCVIFYTFAPLAYRLSDTLPQTAPGFKAIFTGGAILQGITFVYFSPSAGILIGWMFLTLVATGGVFLWYLSAIHGWALSNPYGQIPEVLNSFVSTNSTIDEVRADMERDGIRGVVRLGTVIIGGGSILALPAIFGGFLTSFFIAAYPMPDLVFLSWAIGAELFPRISTGLSKKTVHNLQFDVEKFLVDALENVQRSFQGLIMTAFIVVGFLFPAGLFSIFPALILAVVEEISSLPTALSQRNLEALLVIWFLLGATLLVVMMGCLALWGWVREFRRLSYFLDRWEKRGTTTGEPPPRVPGISLVPSIAILCILGTGTIWTGLGHRMAGLTIFALIWPLLIVIGWWTIRRARRDNSQPLSRENYWIAGSLYAQSGPLIVPIQILRASETNSSVLIGWEIFGPPVGLAVFVAWITGLPVVNHYEKTKNDTREYTAWYLIGSGSIMLSSLPILPTIPFTYRTGVFILIAFSILGGILLYITD